MTKRGLAARREVCAGTCWSYTMECSFFSWWGGANWIHERARSIQKRDAQCRNLSMQCSVRNAGVQSRRFRQAQTHHKRPGNRATGGKGMWVGIEMKSGREKRFIDKIIKNMRLSCTEEGLKSEQALECFKYFNAWWVADSCVDQSECTWRTQTQS